MATMCTQLLGFMHLHAQRNSLTYLHPMGGEAQLLLVAPQHLGTGLDGRSGEQLVKVGDLILAVIADQDQHGPLAGHHRPLDERPDAGVELLADHCIFGALFFLGAD